MATSSDDPQPTKDEIAQITRRLLVKQEAHNVETLAELPQRAHDEVRDAVKGDSRLVAAADWVRERQRVIAARNASTVGHPAAVATDVAPNGASISATSPELNGGLPHVAPAPVAKQPAPAPEARAETPPTDTTAGQRATDAPAAGAAPTGDPATTASRSAAQPNGPAPNVPGGEAAAAKSSTRPNRKAPDGTKEDPEAARKRLVRKEAEVLRIQREAREEAERNRPPAQLIIRRMSEVPDEPLRMFFGGRLVHGSFQMMVGPDESGKGMVSTDIISRLSTGAPFPGEDQKAWRAPVTVAVCVTEDSAARVKARLLAAGADIDDHIYVVDGPATMIGGLSVPSPIAFGNDAGALLKELQGRKVGAFWLETTLEHLGDRESRRQMSTNSEFEVRRALAPIMAMCKVGGLVGWGVMHPRKTTDGGIEDSISGSAAFRNVGRSVLHVYRDPKDSESEIPWRLLITSKANYLAKRPPTLRFRLESWDKDPDEGRVVWGIDGRNLIDDRSAEEVWREIRDQHRKAKGLAPQVQKAVDLLKAMLADGAVVDPAVIRKRAEEADIAWRTVQTAREHLGVDYERIKKVPAKGESAVLGWKLWEKGDDDM